jgi:hypothetical protein
MAKDHEERENHESYVMVGFSRRQGSPGRLFGSSLKTHESYVTLKVSKGERIHSLGYDRYYGGMNGDILEVDLSAAQFAELLTTMNVGSGVPGTLRRAFNKRVEPASETELEVEKIRVGFKKKMGDLASTCRQDIKDVEALLEKKGLVKADKEAILAKFRRVMMEVESNTPFMLSQFEEATEKVVTHAKAEVDAFMTHNVVSEGLRALAAKMEPESPQLTDGPVEFDPEDSDEHGGGNHRE